MILSNGDNERLNKNFEVKGICRADLIEYIGEKKAIEMSDAEMECVIDKMSDYIQDDYWRCLDEALYWTFKR